MIGYTPYSLSWLAEILELRREGGFERLSLYFTKCCAICWSIIKHLLKICYCLFLDIFLTGKKGEVGIENILPLLKLILARLCQYTNCYIHKNYALFLEIVFLYSPITSHFESHYLNKTDSQSNPIIDEITNNLNLGLFMN